MPSAPYDVQSSDSQTDSLTVTWQSDYDVTVKSYVVRYVEDEVTCQLRHRREQERRKSMSEEDGDVTVEDDCGRTVYKTVSVRTD